MQTISELLEEVPFFSGIGPGHQDLLAGCAVNVHVARDEYLAREGEPAERFFVIRHGRVAVETGSPAQGALILDTGEDGDVVGWEWLVPPYRSLFDIRATEPTSAIAMDGACLRGKCAADHDLGYAFLHRVAGVMFHQLAGARVRLLDIYGTPHARG